MAEKKKKPAIKKNRGIKGLRIPDAIWARAHLMYLEGVTDVEIASTLNISRSALKKRRTKENWEEHRKEIYRRAVASIEKTVTENARKALATCVSNAHKINKLLTQQLDIWLSTGEIPTLDELVKAGLVNLRTQTALVNIANLSETGEELSFELIISDPEKPDAEIRAIKNEILTELQTD